MNTEINISQSVSRISPPRFIISLIIPLVAFGVQWFFWEALQPYVWFLFYPAVFFSSWIGGKRGGVAATALSILVVWWFFMTPRYSFAIERPANLFAIGVFAAMGILFSLFHERLRKTNIQLLEAMAKLTASKEQLEKRVKERTADLVRTVDSLRESEENLNFFFEYAPAALAMFDNNMCYLHVSQRWRSDYGLGNRNLVGLSHYEIFPEISDEWKEVHRRGLAGEVIREEEDRFVRSDGSIQWVCWEIRPWYKQDENISGIVIFTEDITERKRADEEKLALEQQMISAQKLESLGVLSGGIAHDFNNILTIIIGHCSLAELHYEKAGDHIPPIEKAANRAAELCRLMLTYAGKAQLVQSQINIVDLVGEMVKMLKATTNNNAAIHYDSSTDIPFITGDASQIRQVIMNLIINASEAIGEEQGEIRVSLAKITIQADQQVKDYQGKTILPGWYTCLEVTDNGCGMDNETRQRIFEPFYTTKTTGRGLGMSAVLGIIMSHGGTLQLFSQPGQGTTFKVYLPVQVFEASEDETLQGISSVQWQGSGTILLVEDEEQVKLIAKTMLEELGFRVIEASNGKEALDLYQKNSTTITLILTDMGMPVMNGYELLLELKKIRPDLPILISSGFGDVDVTSKIDRDDFARLISKPYGFDQLRKVLRDVLEDSHCNHGRVH